MDPIEIEQPGIETPDSQPESLPDVAPQPGRPAPQISNPVGPAQPSEPSGPGPVVQPGTTVLPTT